MALSFHLFLISPHLHAVVFNPASTEAGVVGKAISSVPAPFTPTPTKGFTPKPAERPTINPEAAKIRFVLNKVIISGNEVFCDEELQEFFEPYMGNNISVAKLQQIVQSITEKYEKAGYFLSKALLPPQAIKNGIVKVTVVEGFISEIKVQGLKRKSMKRFIERYGRRIEACKPIKLSVLEYYLLIMNDVPGFKVKSVLSPDPNVPKGALLTLVVEGKIFDFKMTQDNYQTIFLGPDETAMFAALNSPIIPGGTLSTHILNTDQHRRLKFYELRYDQTIGTKGWVFILDSFLTKTDPTFILTPLDIFSSSKDVSASLTFPLLRTKNRNLSFISTFNYMNNFSNAIEQLLFIDRIRDLSTGLQYNESIWKGTHDINITFDKGYPIFGADGPGFRSRLGATTNYAKIMGTASRTQFLTEKYSLYGLVTGQYTNRVLPAAETFIFGGPYLGRGYDWAQFIDDQGIAAKFEGRMNTAPNLHILKQVQLYIFYDVGRLWSRIPLIEPSSGASAGFGFRSFLRKHFNAEGFFGRPLTTPNASRVIQGKNGKVFLGYFQVSANF